MSSHREAPGISKDPVADNTDLYAFVSPDRPHTVTLIANFIPLEDPPGGPNFFEFGDDVSYEIHVDNDGDAKPNVTYRFRFTTVVENPDTFLYNTGPIDSLTSSSWNRRQTFRVTKIVNGKETSLGHGLACPPCNIGPRSTPNYEDLAEAAIHTLPTGEVVFAGQRAEGFYVDLGAVFDLGDLRPFQHLHLIPSADAPGVNGTAGFNVHTIAIQVPADDLTRGRSRITDPTDPRATIGVWSTASRRRSLVRDDHGDLVQTGPWVQVSRLGNPLFNEVIVPMAEKDRWNALPVDEDVKFLKYVKHPELAGLLPVLYPGVFPNLAGVTAARSDLVAILLTGIPAGIVDGFQNYTGATYADMLRLNTVISPTSKPSIYGILGGDLAGFPNGRRVIDDTVTIELRAVAGATYPLVAPSYTPDAAASAVSQGLDLSSLPVAFRSSFPYLGTPLDGFSTMPAA
ncbi:MAG: DUF4331 domain-containing protein [Actinomycetota bacterium]